MKRQRPKAIELKPVELKPSEFDVLESRIRQLFRMQLYMPIWAQLFKDRKAPALKNAYDALNEAIQRGEISYSNGVFRGRFTAEISRELKEMGAKWKAGKDRGWALPQTEIAPDVMVAIGTSEARFREKMRELDRVIQQKLPEEIAESLEAADLFDSTLWRVDRELGQNAKAIATIPPLSPEERQKIAAEWQGNLQRYIKDFAENEIIQLRKDVQKAVFSGARREAIQAAIQRRYGVGVDKARFLARQETSLLLAKHQEARYTSAGVTEYKWRCVAGSAAHPVRSSHKILDGKVFRWDTPPITTAPSEPTRRNNPGEDYNCRCRAIPIVRLREKPDE